MKKIKIQKKQPKVSVIIPVYNGSSFIGETVSSIFKSNYRNFEVILVDDGSTDKTKKICQILEKKYQRLRFYSFDKNKGMVRCLNFAIAKAKGKYIARLNQDDLMMPDRLKKQVHFLEKNPEYVAIGGAIGLFDDKGKNIDKVFFPLTDEDIRKQWLLLSPFSDPTVMFRKSVFLKTKGYQQSFWPADDVQMWYQLGKLGKLRNLKDVLTKVRWHDKAGSIRFHRLQIKKTWKLHLWAATNVQSPTKIVWAFWIIQYLAGIIFPPRFNWFIFRILRKIQWQLYSFQKLPLKVLKKIKVIINVIPHPKILNFSGQ